MRARLVPVVGLVSLLALAGCGADSGTVAGAAKDGGRYVVAGGTIEKLPAAERVTAIRVQGTTLEGKPLDTAEYAGQVVVINTWGSWCPPCNAEARDLQRVYEQVRGDGVRFVGVNLRESAPAGQAFQRKYGITYPSVGNGTAIQPQLKGKAASTPTTLVLDRQGRLAARISAQADATTLRTLISDVVKEAA